jgi:DNA-binding CsgD family transcriptional regulator/energy-coupling factor transporter ATP-binding protein EcfA2
MDLVGRARGLSAVVRALDDVDAGSRRLLGVIGESGIGKSALLAAIAGLARERGLPVLERRAAAHERYVPHAAVDADLLARLDRPAVLLLDDMHWADPPSADLVIDLLNRPPAAPYLLVAASRQRGAGPALRLLGEASRVPGFEELHLASLDRDASLALLAGVGDLGDRERMAADARGNPLYLTELARSAGRSSVLSCPLLASVEVELAALSRDARTLVEGAAVAGDPFDPELAAAAAGLELDAALVDELVGTDLVLPACGPTFAFRHPMVCRAIYHGAAPAWRLAAHERAAEALERRGAGVAVRARHVARFARPGDEAAIALLVEAAECAGAVRWYEAALRLAPEEQHHAELLGPFGLALAREGRLAEARDALAEASAEPDLVIACARLERLLGDPHGARRRLRAAYEARPDAAVAFELATDEPEWAASAAATTDPILIAGLDALDAETVDRAGARVRDLDDEALADQLPVLERIGRAQLAHQRLSDAAATADRALAVARRTHHEDTLVALHDLRGTVLWLQLDLDAALAEARAAEEAAARQGVPYIPRLRARLHHDRGEIAEADRCSSDPAEPPAGAESAPLVAAEARQLAARAHAADGATERAKALLQQVAADAGRGGALRLRDAAARELRRLGTRVAARSRHSGGDLTERERTVAELVAGGRSNKQVAAALFLSEGTIENTLTRVYAKLGVRSRTQLTSALCRSDRGILDEVSQVAQGTGSVVRS